MRVALKLLVLSVLTLALVMVWRAWRLQPDTRPVAPLQVELDASALAARLGAALAIPTESATPQAPSLQAFVNLHGLLRQQFPRVHAQLQSETVAGASLLYRWVGREACAPLLLLAHQDVVPVEPGTESKWRQPPYSGALVDGEIWGRGAIDDKSALLGLLEAVEHLLATNYTPRCDVYLAFGHDEEVSGMAGATALATLLEQRGVRPALVLDEGGAITTGSVPGVAVPLATIGVAEKGYLSVRLRSQDAGGHSSMPPRRTAIGRLARAVARLEEQRPAAEFPPVQQALLERIAPYLPWPRRIALANLWLTAPLVQELLAATPASDATLRTTTAPTLFHAGIKDNVLAQQAEAVVNFRIRPGDSIAGVLEHVRATIDDEAVRIEPIEQFSNEPTAASRWDDPAFELLEQSLRSVSPEPQLIVAPYVTSGGTDARHYARISDRLYRFLPVHLSPELLASFHGSNERIPVAEYLRMVRFYIALIRGFGPLPAAVP